MTRFMILALPSPAPHAPALKPLARPGPAKTLKILARLPGRRHHPFPNRSRRVHAASASLLRPSLAPGSVWLVRGSDYAHE